MTCSINCQCNGCLSLMFHPSNLIPEGVKLMDKQSPGPAQETPWTKMLTQEGNLDRALTAIQGNTQESNLARTYIIAQIEALRWARKLYEV